MKHEATTGQNVRGNSPNTADKSAKGKSEMFNNVPLVLRLWQPVKNHSDSGIVHNSRK